MNQQYVGAHENFAILQDYGVVPPSISSTGIKTILMDFDSIDSDEACKLAFESLSLHKQKGFKIITSIDADAGFLNTEPESFKRDLTDIRTRPWLQQLYQLSDVIMFFHSPGFTDQKYAKDQAKEFRKLHVNGYSLMRRK